MFRGGEFHGRDMYGPGFWKGDAGRPGLGGGRLGGGRLGGGGFSRMKCRVYPWLSRGWRAFPPMAVGAAALAAWGPWGRARPDDIRDEAELLRRQAEGLRAELASVEKRLSQMEKGSEGDNDGGSRQ